MKKILFLTTLIALLGLSGSAMAFTVTWNSPDAAKIVKGTCDNGNTFVATKMRSGWSVENTSNGQTLFRTSSSYMRLVQEVCGEVY